MNALSKDFLAGLPLTVPPASLATPAGIGGLRRQPLIRTGRLTLRRPDRRDAEAIAAALSDQRVARMLADVPQPHHLEDAEEWLADPERDSAWLFAITLGGVRAILSPSSAAANSNEADRLIGLVSIAPSPEGEQPGWRLGYWLDTAHWGKGIASEAVNAVIARFFAAHMGEVLQASVPADNPAALRIHGKFGFDITGVREVYSLGRAQVVRLIETELTFGGYMPA